MFISVGSVYKDYTSVYRCLQLAWTQKDQREPVSYAIAAYRLDIGTPEVQFTGYTSSSWVPSPSTLESYHVNFPGYKASELLTKPSC